MSHDKRKDPGNSVGVEKCLSRTRSLLVKELEPRKKNKYETIISEVKSLRQREIRRGNKKNKHEGK